MGQAARLRALVERLNAAAARFKAHGVSAEQAAEALRTFAAAANPIRTSYINPPVPSRQYDWEAIRRYYDEGDPIGRGPTEQAAIDDLLGQEEL